MSEIQQFEGSNDPLLLGNGRSQQKFIHLLINIVMIVLAIAAYFPALIDLKFYSSMPRFIITIILGVLYTFLGTYGMIRQEIIGTKTTSILYFIIQISIVLAILRMGQGINDNFWLLMLPLSAQGLSLGWIGAFVVSVVQLIGMQLLFWDRWTPANAVQSTLSIAAAMTFTVLFTSIAVRESVARKEVERLATDLREANRRLAQYAIQVDELATVRERNRLAREIHDDLGHYLTVVNVQLEAARTIMASDPDKAQEIISKAQGLTKDGLNAIRQSVSSLRASPLAERPLPEAIAHLAKENDATGMATRVTVNGTVRVLPPQTALTIYRTAQEGLTNARKHACASHINLILDYEQPHKVIFTVVDNGVGTDYEVDTDLATKEVSPESGSGFGLLGLHERVKLLNGTLIVDTSLGNGYSIQVSIPTPT